MTTSYTAGLIALGAAAGIMACIVVVALYVLLTRRAR